MLYENFFIKGLLYPIDPYYFYKVGKLEGSIGSRYDLVNQLALFVSYCEYEGSFIFLYKNEKYALYKSVANQYWYNNPYCSVE